MSRAMPRQLAPRRPPISASAATPRWLEETIWPGPGPLPGATSSSPVDEDGDARAAAHGNVPWPMAAASDSSRGPRRRPAAEQRLALAEIEAAAADVALIEAAVAHGDLVAVALGVLLDDDGVGAGRQRRAGEDAHGLARGRRCRRRDGRRRPGRSRRAWPAGSRRRRRARHSRPWRRHRTAAASAARRAVRPACAGARPRWRRLGGVGATSRDAGRASSTERPPWRTLSSRRLSPDPAAAAPAPRMVGYRGQAPV